MSWFQRKHRPVCEDCGRCKVRDELREEMRSMRDEIRMLHELMLKVLNVWGGDTPPPVPGVTK